MIDRALKRETRLAIKNRRQEIEQQLAAFGLARGPRRLFRGESSVGVEEDRIRRVRQALQALGPIFSSFGLYLSSRVDLWSPKECLELASIPDRGPASASAAVKRLLDGLPEEAFDEFEAIPFESRLLFQFHHARLINGTEVVVKIIHPKAESHLLYDVDLLLLLRNSLAGSLGDSAFIGAVADFGHSLERQLDFVHEIRALKTLAEDAEEYDALRAPQVYDSLCTSKVLTTEKLDGFRLDQILTLSAAGIGAEQSPSAESVGFEREEFARLLCEVWLRQALMGRCFPVEPNPENIQVLPGKQIAFTGGDFATLAAEPQANLWNYLLAAANEESDKACSYLLKELRKEGVVREDVRQRFRQAMPFRDGGWDAGGDGQSLAELLFVQWKFASECGYTPLMHLPAFYRGLFSVAHTTHQLGVRIDPLAEGVRDLRLLSGLARFGKMMGQGQFADQVDGYGALMMNLPQSLDEALTSLSEGRARFNSQVADAAGHRAKGNSSAVVAALLLVLAAVVLLSHYANASGVAGAWLDRISAIAFVTISLLLLRAASFSR